MALFLDTSVIYAILDRSDANHEAASAAWDSIEDGEERLVTTNYVLLEATALLQRRLGVASVRDFQTRMAPLAAVIWVDEDLHERAMASLLTAGRRDLNLVDCVSFAAMRQMDLDTAFAFDAHFAEQGFRLIP